MGEVSIEETLLYQRLGENIRKDRDESRFTQEKLAQKLGLARTSVTNIESGNQRPPLHLLYAIAKVLGVEVKDLLPSVAEVEIEKPEPENIVRVGATSMNVPPKTASFIREVLRDSGGKNETD